MQSLVLHKLLHDDKLSGRRYKLETGLKGSIHILSHLQSIKALRGNLARELKKPIFTYADSMFRLVKVVPDSSRRGQESTRVAKVVKGI